ncbi:MAG: CbiX/SirB N-terminal domain-containing protein [Pirellulaceae bacterium]
MSEKIEVSETGIIVVDHGSHRDESNRIHLDLVRMFERSTSFAIIEPAHMELAEPSLASAFQRCVERGARLVVIHPYFLLPGRHWEEDIPRLAAEAAQQHAGVSYLVTAPIGLHPRMAEVIHDRVRQCMDRALRGGDACDLRETTDRCGSRTNTTTARG